MKYGETLRQRSIPEWAHYNVDYDDIKHLIKVHTTPGHGKAVSIPGQGNASENELERELLHVLIEQHQRIGLFVKSKTWEIERRLDQLANQVTRLRSRGLPTPPPGMPARLVEKYSKLEGATLKVGEEIRSLSRFNTAQRLAFIKLLKKYRRWTGSDALEYKFKDAVLDKPGSLSKDSVTHLLDQWTMILHDLRSPFFDSTSDSPIDSLQKVVPITNLPPSPTVITQLRASIEQRSEVDFDVSFAMSAPGEGGSRAIYWVHPDNIVELQVLLLKHTRHFESDRRSSLAKSSGNTTPSRRTSVSRQENLFPPEKEDDTGCIVLDDLESFAQKQSGATVNEIEDVGGTVPMEAAGTARWTSTGVAMVVVKDSEAQPNAMTARMKPKNLGSFLDVSRPYHSRKMSTASLGDSNTDGDAAVRAWITQHNHVQPLVGICSKRTRFVGLGNSALCGEWCTLDQDICMKRITPQNVPDLEQFFRNPGMDSFPHAVLEIRQHGRTSSELIDALDGSHLTERVRGFSVETHAVWTCCHPKSMSAPFWLPLLTKDIRKVPEGGSSSQPRGARTKTFTTSPEASTPNRSGTRSVGDGESSSSTLMGDPSGPSGASVLNMAPPLRAFRKKRKRSYPERTLPKQTCQEPEPLAQRYWSEYDHPEDGDDDNAYVIYVDPNASTLFPGQETLSRAFQKMRNLFTSPEEREARRRKSRERESLLRRLSELSNDDYEDVSSSSESGETSPVAAQRGYGSFIFPVHPDSNTQLWDSLHSHASQNEIAAPPLLPIISLAAATVIITMSLALADTGRRKLRQTVDVGILTGVVMSLSFAMLAALGLCAGGLRTRTSPWLLVLLWVVFCGVCAADGVLIAWVFGADVLAW